MMQIDESTKNSFAKSLVKLFFVVSLLNGASPGIAGDEDSRTTQTEETVEIDLHADYIVRYGEDGTIYAYDREGRPYSVRERDGVITVWGGDGTITEYDHEGNVLDSGPVDDASAPVGGDGQGGRDIVIPRLVPGATQVDDEGTVTEYSLGGDIRRVETVDGAYSTYGPDGSITDYDRDGNITGMQATDGSYTSYLGDGSRITYDQDGNMVGFSTSDGTDVVLDEEGRITSSAQTTADGSVVQFNRDGTVVEHDHDGTMTQYDQDGNITGVTTADGAHTAYDGNGNAIDFDQDGSLAGIATAEGGYVEFGQRGEIGDITMTESDGTVVTVAQDGNVTITGADETITQYRPDGSLESRTTPDGITYSYDSEGNLTGWRDDVNGAEMLFLPESEAPHRDVLEADGTVTGFDTEGRLTVTTADGTITRYFPGGGVESTTLSSGITFSYDREGNLLEYTDEVNGINQLFDPASSDAPDRVTLETDGTVVGFDSEGRFTVTTADGNTRTYDYDGRVVSTGLEDGGTMSGESAQRNTKTRQYVDPMSAWLNAVMPQLRRMETQYQQDMQRQRQRLGR